MNERLENLLNLASNLYNNLYVKDYYFVENIALSNLCGYPALMAKLPNSTGSVTYTSHLNTYVSPSMAFLAVHHKALNSALSSLINLALEIQSINQKEDQDYTLPNDFLLHFSKAFGGSLHNYTTDLIAEDVTITHYESVETYAEEATSHHQPYVISSLNFKKMENDSDYKGLFNGAMFAKSLVASIDFLMFSLHGDLSTIQTEIDKLSESQKSSFMLKFQVDEVIKRMTSLEHRINEEYERNYHCLAL